MRRFFHSLYIRLLLVIIFGVIASAVAFILVRQAGLYYINNYYVSEENREMREAEYIADLRSYITHNGISSDDTDMIARWSQGNRYVYLLVYKNDELFFSSDMLPEKPEDKPTDDETDEPEQPPDSDEPTDENPDAPSDEEDKNQDKPNDGDGSFGSGITVDFPSREELKKYAEENDLYELEMSDGILFASVAEFTEYLYYDIANIASLIISTIALAIILVNYFRRIISRIKKLEQSVMLVAEGDINHKIKSSGYDEIARLSGNVENMRCTILESIEDERRARRANTELITAMSHDIRTPLTVLLGYLEVMKTTAKDDTMREYVDASERTAMRLKSLSDDMFNYFLAFGSTKENMDIQEYDAAMLFVQMLSEHLLLLSEKGHKLEYAFDIDKLPEGSTVKTDAPKLMRIVDNIFSNVTKYADKEKPVFIGGRVEGDNCIIEVKNKKLQGDGTAESNGIGLKTCERLATFVAEDFEVIETDTDFAVRLTVKIFPPQ